MRPPIVFGPIWKIVGGLSAILGFAAGDEMGKVVVLVETAALSVADHRREAAPQRGTLDVLELFLEIDPAVPDFERRKTHQSEHVFAIGGDRACREAARALVRHVRRPGGDGDAGRQTLDVDGEIDAGQRLIEIVDVEEDVVFGRIERAEVHQMAVAAGLHRRPGKSADARDRPPSRPPRREGTRTGSPSFACSAQAGDLRPARRRTPPEWRRRPDFGGRATRRGRGAGRALAAFCPARIGLALLFKAAAMAKILAVTAEGRRQFTRPTARRHIHPQAAENIASIPDSATSCSSLGPMGLDRERMGPLIAWRSGTRKI